MKATVIEKPSNKLAEIFQTVDVKFTMLRQEDNKYYQVSTPAKCRDFLLDLLWSRHYKAPYEIYGMIYDWNKDPFDTDALKLSLTFPSKEKKKWFLTNVVDFLSLKEQEANVVPTQVIETTKSLTLIVIASPYWMSTTWKLSLYTYYLKVCCYEDVTKLDDPEVDYAHFLTKKKETTLLSYVTDDFTFFHSNYRVNHNCGGFISLIKDSYGTEMPFYKQVFGGKK